MPTDKTWIPDEGRMFHIGSGNTAEERHKAVRAVLRSAEDAAEATKFLDMLGLSTDDLQGM